jgi:hypothetical protein
MYRIIFLNVIFIFLQYNCTGLPFVKGNAMPSLYSSFRLVLLNSDTPLS